MFRGKVDRDRVVNGTVPKEGENQWFQRGVESMMEILEPPLDEVYVGVGDTTGMLQVKEVGPGLHIFMKALLTLLLGSMNLQGRNGNTWMASNVGEKPKDLIATKLSDEKLREFTILEVGGASSKSLVEDLIVKRPLVMTMCW